MSLPHKKGPPSLRQRHLVEQAVEAGHKTVSDIALAARMNAHQVRWVLRHIGRDDLIRKRTINTDPLAFKATPYQLQLSLEAALLDARSTAAVPPVSLVRWHMERIVGDKIIPDAYVRTLVNNHYRKQAKVEHRGRPAIIAGEELEALYIALRPSLEEQRCDAKLVQRLGNRVLGEAGSKAYLTRTNAYRYMKLMEERFRSEKP